MKTTFDCMNLSVFLLQLKCVSCNFLQLKCISNDCMNLCLWIMAFFIILYYILIKKINVQVAYAKHEIAYAMLFHD